MKKWLIVLFAGIVLTGASVYIFVPNTINLRASIFIKATRPGIHRMLLNKSSVAKWWPGKISGDSLYFNDCCYKISDGNITVLRVSVRSIKNDLATSLFLISFSTDSTKMGWVGTMQTSYNPVKRFLAYREAKKIKKDMKAILQKMDAFYSKPENIYGAVVKNDLIVDGILVAYVDKRQGYPATPFVYGLLDKLKAYAAANAAKEFGFPMMNIRTTDSIYFDYIVALPIDKKLPTSGDILQKRLPGNCHMLVTEVRGGLETVNEAFRQMQYYMDDHQRKAPALPFNSLITDRSKEPDTSKWITKVYFPVL